MKSLMSTGRHASQRPCLSSGHGSLTHQACSIKARQPPACHRSPCRRVAACRAQHGGADLLTDEQPSSSGLWTPGQPAVASPSEDHWGLSSREVQALGLTRETGFLRPEPDPALLTARAYYGGYKPFDVKGEVTTARHMETRMAARSGRSPPPDLPSLLLDGRIVYLGMPITAKVTELIICELLWLNYSNPEAPLNIYVHSIGTQTQFHQAIAFETDAYAIMDTLAYIRPKVYTLVIGQAFGNAAMIVASGAKGCRFATPNSRLMTAPPRLNRNFGSTKNIMIRANELENNTQTYVKFMARATGKDPVEVRKDVGRNRYFSAQEAIDYGLIDRISTPLDLETVERKDYENRLQAQMNAQQRSKRVPAGAGAGGGGPETGF